MDDKLQNPAYNALISGDAPLALGSGLVRYFPPEVSPFAGFQTGYDNGFKDLYDQVPGDRKIVYARPEKIQEPAQWEILVEMEGLQFVYNGVNKADTEVNEKSFTIKPLTTAHVTEMVALATLTKPGPFDVRTIEFGHYHGVFSDDKLVAMTGQRMHVYDNTEISAVCTHPDHLGKGYAAALMQHQVELILSQGKRPFLHVRRDNARAIALYQRLGFEISRDMNFYFMRKRIQ